MGEDGKERAFDVVDMEELIRKWSEEYAPGVTVEHWYYDPFQQVVLLQLEIDPEEASDG